MNLHTIEQRIGGVRRQLAIAVVFWVCAACGLCAGSAPQHVLVLHSYHRGNWSDKIHDGILSVISETSYVEYMDTKKLYSDTYLETLHELYQFKYKDIVFDVVIATDDNAYTFSRMHQSDLFHDAPIVFCGVSDFKASDIENRPITGVLEIEPYNETLDLAFSLFPQTRTVYLFCDDTRTGLLHRDAVLQYLKTSYPHVQHKDLWDYTFDEMRGVLRTLPPDSIVLHIALWKDKTGHILTKEENTALLQDVNRPVFCVSEWKVSRGSIGGKCISPFQQGYLAGQLAEQILNGTDPASIPVKNYDGAYIYKFDHQLLEKYNISESQLPQGAEILNAPKRFYQIRRGILWGLMGLIVGLLFLIKGLFWFIRYIRKINRKLHAQEQKFRNLVEASTDWIWEVDAHGRYIYVSPQIETIVGYKPQGVLGKTPYDFMLPAEAERVGAIFEEAVKEKKSLWHLEKICLHRDGSEVILETNGIPILDTQGALKGYRGIDRDITKRKAAEAAREKLMAELQAKNKELQSIVFIASHDLRSPLVNIRGFAGELEKSLAQLQTLLEKENLSSSTQKELDYLFNSDIPESIGFINSGNQKMDTLLNGLLRLSRIGTAQINLVKLDINLTLQGIINNFLFRIRREDIEITLDDQIPPCMGDATLINQVFTNLIDNAIKYRHPERPAKIHISGKTQDHTVVFCVKDNGIGIEPEHIDKTFEIFHRLDPSDGNKGDGLGLTIVYRILNRQNGSIWIESEPDAGTSVYVQLLLPA